MRITLEIDEDIYRAARDIANRRRVALGKVLSDLARAALAGDSKEATRNGIPLFPVKPDGRPVTNDLIKRLGEESE